MENIYYYKSPESIHLIRFYDNKTVIGASYSYTEKLLENVYEWFDYNLTPIRRICSSGKYFLIGNHIFFELKSRQGIVRYEGIVIDNDLISLNSESLINNFKSYNKKYFNIKNYNSHEENNIEIDNFNFQYEEPGEFYPIILIPKVIVQNIIYETSIFEVIKTLKIDIPQFKEIAEPDYPSKEKTISEEKLEFKGDGCVTIAQIPMTLFFIYMFFYTVINNKGGISILFLVISIFCIFNFFKFKSKTEYKSVNLSKNDYEKEVESYNLQIEEIKNQRQKNENEYLINHKKFEIELSKNIEFHKKNIYLNSIKPFEIGIKSDDKIQRGKSELFFLSHLIKKFGSQIKMDYKLDLVSYSYYPDFVFICEKTNLHIDIEIDEPYSLIDKNPIHYINSNDEERNNCFIENNWIVVRFSEVQILKNVDDCIQTIESIINSINKKSLNINIFPPKHSRWTYEEALVYSYQDYRKTLE